MMTLKTRSILFLLLLPGVLSAQVGLTGKRVNTDSMEKVLSTSKKDTNKVILLNKLAIEYKLSDPEKAIKRAEEGFQLGTELNYPTGQMASLNQLGLIYKNKGDFDKALDYYSQALAIGEKAGIKNLCAKITANMASIYTNHGNFPKGLELYLRSLDYFEKLQDQKSIAGVTSNIGIVYSRMEKSSTALEYYHRALEIRAKINDQYGIANDLDNIGVEFCNIAQHSGKAADYDTAIVYFKRSMKMMKEFGDKQGVAESLDNMAQPMIELAKLSGERSKFTEAEKLINQALAINMEIGDKSGIAACYSNLATLYAELKMTDRSIEYDLKALAIAKEIGQKEWMKANYHGLSSSYAEKKDYKTALEYFTLYSDMKDSLLNETSSKQIAEMQSKYESEKKQRAIESLEQKNSIQQLAAEQQRTLTNSVIIGLVLVVLLALVLFNRYRVKKKANEQLSEQNKLIEEKNTNLQLAYSIIEEKNKNITDSINYAKRIQEALLPAKELKYRLFPDAFVLFQPRDIVSGDFYWFAEQNGKKLIAAVDCTGHGVPGAFMSMIGNAFLNEIVIEKNITSPARILDELRSMIIGSLKQNDGANKDGMDIALLCFEADGSARFAGANNPCWIYRSGSTEAEEVRADKQPIGQYEGQPVPFSEQTIRLSKGDSLYIFTDGYADQFGGDKGKKFKYKNLQKLISTLQDRPMKEQEAVLQNSLNEWKGNLEQVDDILVIGIRV